MNGNWEGCFGGDTSLRRKRQFWPMWSGYCGTGETVGTASHILISAHCLQLQVRVWFQNRRVKYQKQQRLKPPATSAMAASPDEPSSSSDTGIQREDTESGVDS